eukprot:s462_g47.t1
MYQRSKLFGQILAMFLPMAPVLGSKSLPAMMFFASHLSCPAAKIGRFWCNFSRGDGARLSTSQRPTLQVPPRVPGRDLVAFIRDVSGVALGLSPAAASAAGYSASFGSSAASGIWEKVEILPWTLLHPQPNLVGRGSAAIKSRPSWEGAACTVRWRFHVVDLRAKPTEFHAGNKNTWRFNDGAGYWSQMKVLPGILTVEMYMERTLPLQVELGVMRNAPSESEPEVRAVVLADQLCMCLEHRRPELGLHCLCPEALLEANAPLPPPSEAPQTVVHLDGPTVNLDSLLGGRRRLRIRNQWK